METAGWDEAACGLLSLFLLSWRMHGVSMQWGQVRSVTGHLVPGPGPWPHAGSRSQLSAMSMAGPLPQRRFPLGQGWPQAPGWMPPLLSSGLRPPHPACARAADPSQCCLESHGVRGRGGPGDGRGALCYNPHTSILSQGFRAAPVLPMNSPSWSRRPQEKLRHGMGRQILGWESRYQSPCVLQLSQSRCSPPPPPSASSQVCEPWLGPSVTRPQLQPWWGGH